MNRATLLLLLAAISCHSPVEPVTVLTDFTKGTDGWEADASDFTSETAPSEFLKEPRQRGFYFSAHNRSDDVFLFLRRRLEVAPNRPYRVSYSVTFASPEGSGCPGAGGSPGESVFMKLGLTATKPVVQQQDGYFGLSADKGQQSEAGKESVILGNVANGGPCTEPKQFLSITRKGAYPHIVRSNAAGELWAFVGTDSGYEGLNMLYYERVELTLTPLP